MKIFLLLFIVFISSNALEFKSSQNKVKLIELYTSEGCSSCPRADTWLNNLKHNDKLFKDFIPLAFHVTYWNFIGWKDSFAKKENDSRQRYYSKNVWEKESVYTPQFIIDTQEYRAWFKNDKFPTLKKEYAGILKVKTKNIEVTFNTKSIKNENVFVNMAILGFDYNIKIKSGENKNKELEHDFVILEHKIKFSSIKNNKLEFKGVLPNFKKDTKKKALVVWISKEDSSIIQASASYL